MENKVGIRQATKKGYIECRVGGVADFSYPESKLRRGRVQGGGRYLPHDNFTEHGNMQGRERREKRGKRIAESRICIGRGQSGRISVFGRWEYADSDSWTTRRCQPEDIYEVSDKKVDSERVLASYGFY